MDAVLFVKEYQRMCRRYINDGCCTRCKLSYHNNVSSLGCDKFIRENPEEAVEIVEYWSKYHPVKTNRQKFEEVFGISPSLAGYQQNHTRAERLPCEWWEQAYIEPKENKE